MRMYAVYQKSEALAWLSHLDVQRTLQRGFRRAGIALAYSEGFNPHPKMSFASAAATGMASDAEWFEVTLEGEISPEELLSRCNAALPAGLQLIKCLPVPENAGKLTALVCAADYVCRFLTPVDPERLRTALDTLLAGPVVVEKKTKGGPRPVDIRPQVLSCKADGDLLFLRGTLNVEGGLRPGLLLGALASYFDTPPIVSVTRTAMYFAPDAEGLPHA